MDEKNEERKERRAIRQCGNKNERTKQLKVHAEGIGIINK